LTSLPKIVLITGAGRGIGKAIACELSRHGCTIALHYHQNSHTAAETLNHLAGEGHALFQADLRIASHCKSLTERVKNHYSRLDVLINNAAAFTKNDVFQQTYEQWQAIWEEEISLNLTAPALLSFSAGKMMAKSGGGKIINISSRGAFRGEPDAPQYGASKAGLNSLGQSLAQKLAPQGVYVYTVAPGFIETDMVSELLAGEAGDSIRAQSALNRAGKPDEIARLVRFLALEADPYLTGAIIDINGASYLRN
jgi:3-oxoacyl-[acyl-carrier protein] reductase